MATPRAVWSGRLRLSLASIPVQLYPATASASKLRLHQIHEPTGKRVHHEKVVPGEGPVDTDEIIKGYECDKGRYGTLGPEEIEEPQRGGTRQIRQEGLGILEIEKPLQERFEGRREDTGVGG